MHTLENALADFTKPEEVMYEWTKEDEIDETTGKPKVEMLPTAKRATLHKLPKHLIIHLKRFAWDMSTGEQRKVSKEGKGGEAGAVAQQHILTSLLSRAQVNERFVFPPYLNMRPYTTEGIAEAESAASDSKGDAPDGADDGAAATSPEPAEDPDFTMSPDSAQLKHEDLGFIYRLAGVVIHAGTMSGGHYYSLIRDRRTDDNTCVSWGSVPHGQA